MAISGPPSPPHSLTPSTPSAPTPLDASPPDHRTFSPRTQRVFRSITVNPAATIRLTGRGATGIQRLAELLSDHFSRSAPLLRLNISFTQSTSKVIITGCRNPERGVLHEEKDPVIHLTLGIPTGRAQGPLLITVLEGAHTLFSRVQTLSVSLMSDHDVSWSRVFARTPCVTTLNLVGPPGQGFFEVLCDVRQAQVGESPSTCVPLGQLRTLTLDEACRESLRICERGDSDGTFFDQLLDWAILRCNYGVPLEGLQIWRCKGARAEDIRCLRQVIGKVKWDE